MLVTIPTLFTWLRIAAIPILMGVFFLPIDLQLQNFFAAVLFSLLALTDWIDGFLARKLNQTSIFGAFLDPVADKLLVCASILMLVYLQRIDVFVALIIVGRELIISALREWMARIGASESVAVHKIGKYKTATQMIAIALLFLGELNVSFFHAHLLGTVLIWISAILTLWSMVFYFMKALPNIQKQIQKKSL